MSGEKSSSHFSPAISHTDSVALHTRLHLGAVSASGAGYSMVLSCVPPAENNGSEKPEVFTLLPGLLLDVPEAPLLAAVDAVASELVCGDSRFTRPALLCCAAGQSRSPALAAALLLLADASADGRERVGFGTPTSATVAVCLSLRAVARVRSCAAPNPGFLSQLLLLADVLRGGNGARARARTALLACARASGCSESSCGGFFLLDVGGDAFAWAAGADSRSVSNTAAPKEMNTRSTAELLDEMLRAGAPPPKRLMPLLYDTVLAEPPGGFMHCETCQAALAPASSIVGVAGPFTLTEPMRWMARAGGGEATERPQSRVAARAAARTFLPLAAVNPFDGAGTSEWTTHAATGRLHCPCCGSRVGRWSWHGLRRVPQRGGLMRDGSGSSAETWHWLAPGEDAEPWAWPPDCGYFAPAFGLESSRVRRSVVAATC